MGAVNTTYTFTATDVITSTKMNNIIDQTTITTDAIFGNTLEVASGKLKIRSQGITSNELATGSVTSDAILNGTIVNNDISATGAIAGVKIVPNFGSQNILTTGTLTTGTLTAGVGSVISGSSTNEALKITQTGTGDSFVVEDATSPDSSPFVIDTSGNIISGYSSAISNYGLPIPRMQIHGGTARLSITSWSTGTMTGPSLLLSRADSGVTGTHQILDGGDQIGAVSFTGSDGVGFIEGSRIESIVDGIPAVDSMPTRLVFSTTPDGASAPVERMRITDAGDIGIGKTPTTKLDVNGTVTATAFAGPLTGNANTATTLQTARTIALSGDVTGTATSFNGGANITIPVTIGNGAVTQAAASNMLVPAGAVMPFAYEGTPAGWLYANGSTISRTTYASLFAAIGTLYGAGDGVNTFAIPDLRGYFVRGFGGDSGAFGTKQADMAGPHIHTVGVAIQGDTYPVGYAAGNRDFTFNVAGAGEFDLVVPNNSGTETRPKNIAMRYCIKF